MKVIELDSGDGHITLWVYLIPMSYTLKVKTAWYTSYHNKKLEKYQQKLERLNKQGVGGIWSDYPTNSLIGKTKDRYF